MKVKLIKNVTIKVGNQFYGSGDSFDVDKETAERLSEYLEVEQAQSEPLPEQDDSLTVAEIKEQLESKGIEIPKGAKKAELIELLNGE